MDISFSQEDIQFRDEVRAFFKEKYTPDLAERLGNPKTFRAATVEWEKILSEKGWIAPHWPVEIGGSGWNHNQNYIYDVERSAVGAPGTSPFGLAMVGPVIYTFGNEEQKKRFLPRILTSDDWWCQGYSEPGAGSDLAALQTKAERQGDKYIVNGAKIWTTYAQYADWIFCLVRTDSSGRKQEGISFLLIDMKTPGITVSPIHSIDGVHSLNEVSFENVEVPVENLVGEEGKGWTYAKFLLVNERSAIAGVSYIKRLLANTKEYASKVREGDATLLEDPIFQSRFSEIEIELKALEFTELRVFASMSEGGHPGAISSLLKIRGTELQQAAQDLLMDVAGRFQGVIAEDETQDAISHEFGDMARKEYMYGRAATVYGGSNEVQRNVIAKAVLGL